MGNKFVVLLYTGIVAAALTLILWDQTTPVFSLNNDTGCTTLVIDPGHGGVDCGALSENGDKESDVNLSVGLRLCQLLGFCGVSPVMTREEDVSIHDESADTIHAKKVSDLQNRVALVENSGRCLLLSIHQNSYTDPRYSGAQVFYGKGEAGRLWGEMTQELLRQSLDPANNRSAKKIPDTVYLMDKVSCPAILVECGFMSNREEAARLLDQGYQKKIAAALTGACLQYLDLYT